MSRLPMIEQYRERALDQAGLLAALALAHVDEPSILPALWERQDRQLHELLHAFAFTARKLIEACKREGFESSRYSGRPTVWCPRLGSEDQFDFATMSLVEILGRVIHSDELSIERAYRPRQDGSPEPGKSAWAFRVASDRDPPGTANLVYTEFLVTEFLHFDEQLRADIHRARLREAWTETDVRNGGPKPI